MILQEEFRKNERNRNVKNAKDRIEKNRDRDVEKNTEMSKNFFCGLEKV